MVVGVGLVAAVFLIGGLGAAMLTPAGPAVIVALPLLLGHSMHASADIEPGDRPAQVQPNPG